MSGSSGFPTTNVEQSKTVRCRMANPRALASLASCVLEGRGIADSVVSSSVLLVNFFLSCSSTKVPDSFWGFERVEEVAGGALKPTVLPRIISSWAKRVERSESGSLNKNFKYQILIVRCELKMRGL